MPASRSSKPSHCDHGLRRPLLVQSLLAEIFQGRLRGGQHLVTQQLARRHGVSHTPVREALIALAGIGIIDLLPNRGAVVRRLTPRDVREICQVRGVLECAAVRQACGRIEPTALDALARDLERLGGAPARNGFVKHAQGIDDQLHDLIAESCGNRFLAKELGRLKVMFRAFRDVSNERHAQRKDFHLLRDEARQHQAIVAALRAGNRKEAARAMSRHIRAGARYWAQTLRENG